MGDDFVGVDCYEDRSFLTPNDVIVMVILVVMMGQKFPVSQIKNCQYS